MEISQKALQVKMRKTESNTSTSLEGIRRELAGLSVNKYCQNNWKYFDGKCYYFSPPANTFTWAEAQVMLCTKINQ